MIQRRLVAFILVLVLFQCVAAEDKPSIPNIDRIRIAEVFRLNKIIGDHIWKGWSKVPFAVMLITPDYEFLIRHPQPSSDFSLIGYDALLQSPVYFRQRKFPPRLLATAPFIEGSSFPVIAVGEAERTEAKTSSRWVVTLFHEHFHQLQYMQPTYQAEISALNLARGDQSGGWMLNYPFPYGKREIQESYSKLSKLLAAAVSAQSRSDRVPKLAAYLQMRSEFEQMLDHDDYKYFSFQLWQEGIARYTEYRVAKLAAARYRPSKEFRALKDYTSFAQLADETHDRIIKQLLGEQLGESKREVVYPFGAGEGLLLDQVSPAEAAANGSYQPTKAFRQLGITRATGSCGKRNTRTVCY